MAPGAAPVRVQLERRFLNEQVVQEQPELAILKRCLTTTYQQSTNDKYMFISLAAFVLARALFPLVMSEFDLHQKCI